MNMFDKNLDINTQCKSCFYLTSRKKIQVEIKMSKNKREIT